MPKKNHTVLYSLEEIQLLSSGEHHLNDREHFLLQLLQDVVSELRVVKEEVRVLNSIVDRSIYWNNK